MTADADKDANMGLWPARGQLLKQHPAICPENSDTCSPFAGMAASSHMQLAPWRLLGLQKIQGKMLCKNLSQM